MPTIIKAGLYQSDPILDGDDTMIPPYVYLDDEKLQVIDADDKIIAQFSYEELRGFMAIIAAEQEKEHLFIKARLKNN